MSVKVGINGFGRIGRIFLRTSIKFPDICVSAINDPAINAEYICYLIKFDSTHGNFEGTVVQDGDDIKINNESIKIFHEKVPSNVPWQTAEVEYVVEASGIFTNLEKASGHLASETVKRVLVTAPSADIPMMVLGVNEEKVKPEHKVMSCTSSTLYCLAPIVKILQDHFGVAEGFITSIHAMTPSLKPLDGLCLRGKHWRDYRSIHQNIIPATTGSCKALGKIIPELKDKMTGLAFRVPVVDVSVLDITIRLNTNTSLSKIINNIEEASKCQMRDIIKISREEAVSSDFIGDSHSCILDVGSSLQLKPNFYKLICWYENEYSYTCRIINSIKFSENQFCKFQLPSKLTHIRPRVFKMQDVLLKTKTHSRDCSSGITSKILCNISQNAGFKSKPSHRAAVLKKPFTSHDTDNEKVLPRAREQKTKNEIFKIWNDCPESKSQSVPIMYKQNRSTFFHSCIYIAQNGRKKEAVKARETLEKTKSEFAKMVAITEKLLKCNSKKLQSNPQVSIPKDDTNINHSDLTTELSKYDKCRKIIPDVNCDQKYTEKYKNSSITFDKNHDSVSSTEVDDFNHSDYTSLSVTRSDNKINGTPTIPDTLVKQPNDNNNLENSKLANTDANNFNNQNRTNEEVVLKEQLLKNDNTLIDGYITDNSYKHHRNIIFFKETAIEANSGDKLDNRSATVRTETINEIKSLSNYNPGNKSLRKEQTSTKTLNETKVFNDVIKKKYDNIRIIDEELMLLNRQGEINNQKDSYHKPDSFVVEDKCPIGMELSKKELNRLALEPIVTNSQEVSRCPSPDKNNPKQDIFDKLDSTSETDSNDSFEIKKRKSQVIQINDLTNSLEDLLRLDKICRIIEISDELSEQLFSSLNNNDNRLDSKKWSFKDLCERIKLDEFFSKVFEKNVS